MAIDWKTRKEHRLTASCLVRSVFSQCMWKERPVVYFFLVSGCGLRRTVVCSRRTVPAVVLFVFCAPPTGSCLPFPSLLLPCSLCVPVSTKRCALNDALCLLQWPLKRGQQFGQTGLSEPTNAANNDLRDTDTQRARHRHKRGNAKAHACSKDQRFWAVIGWHVTVVVVVVSQLRRRDITDPRRLWRQIKQRSSLSCTCDYNMHNLKMTTHAWCFPYGPTRTKRLTQQHGSIYQEERQCKEQKINIQNSQEPSSYPLRSCIQLPAALDTQCA